MHRTALLTVILMDLVRACYAVLVECVLTADASRRSPH